MKALPTTNFDWDNILYEYNQESTEAQREAVATLMLYCGCAVGMDYAPDGSGADSTPVCDAMEYFFDYSNDIMKVYRKDFDDLTWENLIYNELAKAQPVYYSGQNTNSGHAFVCDGYDNGFFHINWGWNGYLDGYFRLSILNPYVDTSEDGYSHDQMAVINIVPKDFQGFDTVKNIPKDITSVRTYDLQGLQWSKPQRGFHVLQMKDGTTRKVLVK